MNRWPDWWEQGMRDLRHAANALDDGDYEWAAFAAQQSAEKAVKALIMALGGDRGVTPLPCWPRLFLQIGSCL